MKEVKGNLLDLAENGNFDIILHGCNCFHTMNSGIAKEIRKRYPSVYEVDKKFSKYGDPAKLGTITFKELENFLIVNCYSQFNYGYSGKLYLEYGALRSCLKEVKELVKKVKPKLKSDVKIGFPLIGCGKAGGDWNVVKRIIIDELGEYDITLVKL